VGFWPYTVYLSKRRLQALAIDLRCYGESACPQADDASGSSTGLHGWDLLGGANGAGFTPFAAKVAGFASAHTRS
jgi:hypothetical protein